MIEPIKVSPGFTWDGAAIYEVPKITEEQYRINEQIRMIQQRHMAELQPYFDRLTELAKLSMPTWVMTAENYLSPSEINYDR
jgi:hypothetical protein